MLIGLTGPKQAGKDTVYERAAHIMADVLPVERASFADLLYASAAALFDVPRSVLDAGKSDPTARVTLECAGGVHDMTVRTFLQRYGTEAHREIFGGNFWVDNVRLDHAGKLVMVTDVRFKEEADAVRRAGGQVVRVVGPDEVENADDGHASEAGLPSRLIDAWIRNVTRDDNFVALDSAVHGLLRLMLRRGE